MNSNDGKTKGSSLWPDRGYVAEWGRPWKLVTFGVGLGWLVYGALNYRIADWDVGISLIMGGLTYLCAPWCVSVFIRAVRDRPRGGLLPVLVALVVTWGVVDGIYWVYHVALGIPMYRWANFMASLPLFLLAGTGWLYRGSLRDAWANIVSVLRKAGKPARWAWLPSRSSGSSNKKKQN